MENPPTATGGPSPPPLPAAPGERVQAAAREAGERHAPKENKPVGRPPTPGSPHSKFKSNGKAVAKPAAPRNDVPAFAPGVVSRAVGALCSTVDRFVQRRVYNTACAITKDKVLSQGFAEEVGMNKEEAEQIAALSEAVCQQYSIMGEHAPAMLLGVHLAGYSAKVVFTLKKLEEIAQYNARTATPSPPKPDGELPKAA